MRKYLLAIAISLLVLVTTSPAFATSPATQFTVRPPMVLLPTATDANALVGGVPFCFSGGAGNILCYPPSFLKKAYNFPFGLDGKGSTVVIVDAFGSPTIQSDLNLFDTTFGLPATTVTILCPPTWTGAASDNCPVKTIADLTTAPNAGLCGATGWAEETTLDVTQVHGLASGAKIVLVVAADCFDQSINDAENAVVSQKSLRGSIMSQSFGEGEDAPLSEPAVLAQANAIYQKATDNKWTLLASTGDNGAETDATTTLIPSWPATNPLVLAAGGTQGYPFGGQYGFPPGAGGTFSCAAGATCNTGLVIISGGLKGCGTAPRPAEPSSCFPVRYGGEGAWNEWNWEGAATSTGGGVSTIYTRPFYQFGLPDKFTTLLGNTVSAKNARLVPDISFNAAVNGGVLAYLGFLGRWAVFGGTSASSPALAAIIALVNQVHREPVGFITPAIYRLAQSSHYQDAFHDKGSSTFHDIVHGNNSITAGQFGYDGFKASSGYDLTTGLGTLNVAEFVFDIQPFLESK